VGVVKLFLGNRAIVLFILPVVIGFYVLLNLLTEYYSFSEPTSFGIWGLGSNAHPVIAQLLSGILILVNALSINAIFNRNQFLERNNYMSSLLYIVLMSFYHSFYRIDGLLISHSFIVLMIYQLYFLRQNKDGRKFSFNAAFFGGVAVTFHPNLFPLFPFVFLMIWSIRPFVLRETVLVTIGFGIPLLYAAIYQFLIEKPLDFQLMELATRYEQKQIDLLVTLGILSVLFVLSLLSIRARMRTSSIRLKKLVRILGWLVLLFLLLGVFNLLIFEQIEQFSLLMIPLAFFMTFAFTHKTLNQAAIGLFYVTFGYSIVKFFL
jgi:hypothetical protein